MSKNHAVSHACLKDNTFLETQNVNALCEMCGTYAYYGIFIVEKFLIEYHIEHTLSNFDFCLPIYNIHTPINQKCPNGLNIFLLLVIAQTCSDTLLYSSFE